jgi:hypothetical protein
MKRIITKYSIFESQEDLEKKMFDEILLIFHEKGILRREGDYIAFDYDKIDFSEIANILGVDEEQIFYLIKKFALNNEEKNKLEGISTMKYDTENSSFTRYFPIITSSFSRSPYLKPYIKSNFSDTPDKEWFN